MDGMTELRAALAACIEQVAAECLRWIEPGSDGLSRLTDPVEGEEISAHYAVSHAAAAFLLWGVETGGSALSEQGMALLESLLARWDAIAVLPDFHNDFNLFALCLIDSRAQTALPEALRARLREAVLRTPDSRHDTVNWLPMRWYVNLCRRRWTGSLRCVAACSLCRAKLALATHRDGFIDDRLPKGVSFCLQYDAAAAAGLQLLRGEGETPALEKPLGALLHAAAPDGDINYFGRGMNQSFAWGPWLYLLASAGQTEACRAALAYFRPRLDAMLAGHNLLLDGRPGEKRLFWWDYHHASIYTAHLLLWLVLAALDAGKLPIAPVTAATGESGLGIYRSERVFAAVFAGRSAYLSERGPMLEALWLKERGALVKGAFGPLGGAFGRQCADPKAVRRNFAGLMTPEGAPIFAPVSVTETAGTAEVTWRLRSPAAAKLNLPILAQAAEGLPMELTADEEILPLQDAGSIETACGAARLMQSAPARAKTWTLRIGM